MMKKESKQTMNKQKSTTKHNIVRNMAKRDRKKMEIKLKVPCYRFVDACKCGEMRKGINVSKPMKQLLLLVVTRFLTCTHLTMYCNAMFMTCMFVSLCLVECMSLPLIIFIASNEYYCIVWRSIFLYFVRHLVVSCGAFFLSRVCQSDRCHSSSDR